MLCVTDIQQLKTQKGLALEDILTEIHLVVNRLEIPPRVSSQLLINLASIEVSRVVPSLYGFRIGLRAAVLVDFDNHQLVPH